MDKITVVAYALGGGCFAILVSGLDADYLDKHQWTAGLLAAGVPSAIGAAWAWESAEKVGFKLKPWWGFLYATVIGISVAFLGITAFFWHAHPAIRCGYLAGLMPLFAVLYRHLTPRLNPR